MRIHNFLLTEQHFFEDLAGVKLFEKLKPVKRADDVFDSMMYVKYNSPSMLPFKSASDFKAEIGISMEQAARGFRHLGKVLGGTYVKDLEKELKTTKGKARRALRRQIKHLKRRKP